jgi:hypothetical protein
MRRPRALLATGVLVTLVALALSSCGGGASGAGSRGAGEHQQAKARPLPEGKKPLPPGEYHTEAFKPSFSFHVVGKGWRTPSSDLQEAPDRLILEQGKEVHGFTHQLVFRIVHEV